MTMLAVHAAIALAAAYAAFWVAVDIAHKRARR